MSILIWNVTLTEHQVHLFRNLKKIYKSNLIIIIEKNLIRERIIQGWTKPYSEDLAPIVMSGNRLAQGIRLINANPNALHLFSGLWASRRFFLLLLYALFKGKRVGMIVESYSNTSQGRFTDSSRVFNWTLAMLRPPCYKIAGILLGKYICPIFAISPLAVSQFTSAGFLHKNIYPFAYFIPEKKINKIGIKVKTKNILKIIYVGGNIRRKGINEIIDLAVLCQKENLQIHFDLYGPGLDNKSLPILPNVSVFGTIKFGVMQTFFNDYDLLIVPSKYDGWGVVVNEALMQGLPVFVSNKVGSSVLIEQSGAGLVVNFKQKKLVLEKLQDLTYDSSVIRDWKQKALTFRNQISPEIGASYMLECIDANLLSKPKPLCPWISLNKIDRLPFGKIKLKVVMHTRKPKINNFSVENAFKNIRNKIPSEIQYFVSESYFDSKGVIRRILNMIQASLNQGDINHVAGDVHFLTYLLVRNKTILTVLDCVFMYNSSGIKRILFQILWGILPEKKSIIITAISHSTKNELLKIINCNPDKIRVIPIAISDIFSFYEKVFNAEKPKILQIGTSHNKNLIRLAKALQGITCQLIIIGILGEEQKRALLEMNIEYLNYFSLSEVDMLERYRECDLVSFVSTYEGFGMPILEGNAVGRPVITSNIYSMPEIAGDAAILVDPYNIEEIRNGIVRIINDKIYRDQLVQNGFINIKRYNAHLVANEYFKLYCEIAAGSL